MLTLFCVLTLYSLISPVLSNERCVDLAEGGEIREGIAMEMPEGFSVRDLLTIRGEVQKDSPITWTRFWFLTFQNQDSKVARTILNKKSGTFTVSRVSNDNRLLTIAELKRTIQDDTSSLIIQTKCEEIGSTCTVTSQSNSSSISFNYATELPDLLSADKIIVGKEVDQVVTLTSITICRALEPSVETELQLIDSREEGKNFKLICRVTGVPILTATWSKDGEEILENMETELNDSSEEQTLTLTYTFDEISDEDTGIYVCRGRNVLVSEEGVKSKIKVDVQSLTSLIASSGDSVEGRNQDQNDHEGE